MPKICASASSPGGAEMPKSTTFTPSTQSMMFDGVTSRCTTPYWWAADSAAATWAPMPAAVGQDSGPRVSTWASEEPSTSSITMYGTIGTAGIRALAVVVHVGDVGVGDPGDRHRLPADPINEFAGRLRTGIGSRRSHQLHRDRAGQHVVVAPPDDRHPAGRDRRDQAGSARPAPEGLYGVPVATPVSALSAAPPGHGYSVAQVRNPSMDIGGNWDPRPTISVYWVNARDGGGVCALS